jgi:hypothetical protein
MNLIDRKFKKDITSNLTTDSFSFVVKPKSEVLLVWRLLANPWHSKLNILEVSSQNIGFYTGNNSESNLASTTGDFSRTIIEEYLNKNSTGIIKNSLSLDLMYYEIDAGDHIYLVFENSCRVATYKIQLFFPNQENLLVELNTQRRLNVDNQNFNYIKIKKANHSKECKLSHIIAFKKQ